MARLILFMLLLVAPALSAEPLKLSPEEALKRAQNGDITIVDIRLPFEWAETGIPQPATGISLQDQSLQPRHGFLDDVIDLVDGDRDRPIALICARGNRSAFAQKILAANGFTQLYDISEGMVGGAHGPGWLERDLPTSPCQSC